MAATRAFARAVSLTSSSDVVRRARKVTRLPAPTTALASRLSRSTRSPRLELFPTRI